MARESVDVPARLQTANSQRLRNQQTPSHITDRTQHPKPSSARTYSGLQKKFGRRRVSSNNASEQLLQLTTIAWIGLANDAWRVQAGTAAALIRNEARLLRMHASTDKQDASKIIESCLFIEQQTNSIVNPDFILPLGLSESSDPIDLDRFMEDRLAIFDLYYDSGQRLSISYEVKTGDHRPLTLVDRRWIIYAIDNLINLIKIQSPPPSPSQTRQTTELTIHVASNSEGVSIEFRCGDYALSPSILSFLAQPGAKAKVDAIQGDLTRDFGLRLWIIDVMLQAYGGKLAVRQDSEHRTVFRMTFPVHTPTQEMETNV